MSRSRKSPPVAGLSIVFDSGPQAKDKLGCLEAVFARFYRCHLFPKDCQFATNSFDDFKEHLTTYKHPPGKPKLCCFYCKSRDHEDINALLAHYAWEHGNLVVQCNLCLFRASQVLHLVLHHISCHLWNYVKAIRGDKGYERLRSMGTSKIIICESPFPQVRHLDRNLMSCNFSGKIDDNSLDFVCPYPGPSCPLAKFTSLDQLLFHQASTHPNVPICKPENERNKRKVSINAPILSKKSRTLKRNFSSGNDSDDPDTQVEVDTGLVQNDLDLSDEEVRPKRASKSVAFKSKKATKSSQVKKSTAKAFPRSPPKSPPARGSKTVSSPRPSTSFANDPAPNDKDDNVSEDDLSSSATRFTFPVSRRSLKPDLITPLCKTPVTATRYLYCILCKETLLDSKKEQHMKQKHNTRYSLKCKDCEYYSVQSGFREHMVEKHNGSGSFVKVLYALSSRDQVPDQIEEITVTCKTPGPVLCNPQTSKKAANANKNPFKPNKKAANLMEKVKSSTFLGPSKDQRTVKGSARKSTNAKKK